MAYDRLFVRVVRGISFQTSALTYHSITCTLGRNEGKIKGSKLYENSYKVKKFWEELIAYYPLIRHGPHRKRHIQQFFYCCECVFVAAVTFSPSGYLGKIGI
jgi:hypothetical protein